MATEHTQYTDHSLAYTKWAQNRESTNTGLDYWTGLDWNDL